MRIAINCRSIMCARSTGIGRYTYHLLDSLGQIDPRNEYLLYVRRKIIDFTRRDPQVSYPNFRIKRDFFNAGLGKTLGKVDVYHATSPDYLNLNNGSRIVVTVHDLIYKTYPQVHTEKTLNTSERHFQEAVEKAAKIICCSQNTRRALHRFFKIDENRTCVIYQGVDHRMFYPISESEWPQAKRILAAKGVTAPYVLFVGTIEPRKNLRNLLKAFALLKAAGKFQGKLVIAGMEGWMGQGLAELIKDLHIQKDVLFMGYVTDEELRCFYNGAQALVLPSFDEGFGFPVVEAFCCGTPVITSNVSACAEIAADAALTVDPHDPQSIADAMDRMINDGQLKDHFKVKGALRVKSFSFHQTARQTLAVYKEVCGRP